MAGSGLQFTYGKAGTVVYVPGTAIAASQTDFYNAANVQLSGRDYIGLTLGLGLVDPAAWDGLQVMIKVNGVELIVIEDQLCTLLQKEFFPVDIPNNATVSLWVKNGSTINTAIALFMRAESA